MTRLILARIGVGLLTLLAVSLVVFLGTEALPGDAATSALGQFATPEAVEQLRSQFGLDRSVLDRYVDWLQGFLTGDLGTSLPSGDPVSQLIADSVKHTAVLALITTIVLVPLGVAFGILSAVRRNRPTDHGIMVTSLAMISTPEFVAGSLLAVIFGVWLGALPPVSLIEPGTSLFAQPGILVLPIATLIILSVAQLIRMARACMIDVLQTQYIESVRLKGVPERRLLIHHALPNALGPILQVVAFTIAWLAGGVVVVEAVFQFDGIGLAFTNAVTTRDVPNRPGGRDARGGRLRRGQPPCRHRSDPPESETATGTVIDASTTEKLSLKSRVRQSVVYRGAAGSPLGRVGLVLIFVVVGMALLGPVFAPHDIGEIVGLPFEKPSSSAPLGTDMLGRDVLSRYLERRQNAPLDRAARDVAYLRGRDRHRSRCGFPTKCPRFRRARTGGRHPLLSPIIFILTAIGVLGSGLSIIAIAIAITQIPRVVRITRSVTVDLMAQEYVEAAIARGETAWSVLFRDVLPNIWTPVLADFGIRLTGAIILFASIAYLGFGPSPPAADWGLMISENRIGLTLQPWVTIAPAITIALLAIGVNLIADSVAARVGRSTGSHAG